MSMTFSRNSSIGCILLVAALSAPAAAQQANDPLAAVRTKEAIADDDKAAIRTFVTDRITAVCGNDSGAAQEAFTQLRLSYDPGTRNFKEAYATATIQGVGTALAGAKEAAAARLVTLLGQLGVADALPPLLEALKDERAGVRAASAGAIRGLHERIAQTGADNVNKTMAAVKDAARKETAREVLRALYRALNFAGGTTPADPRATIGALLDVLDARAKFYADGEVKADGAEDWAFRVAAGVAGQLNEEDKKRLANDIGQIMRYAVKAYATGPTPLMKIGGTGTAPAQERDRIANLIEEGDKLLTVLLAPGQAPGIPDGMKKGDAKKIVKAWKTWADLLKPIAGADYAVSETDSGDGG